jgi:hypothetical protein
MAGQYQTRSFRFQGYCVIDGVSGLPTDGIGQFIYKDHLISFSARGYSTGACLSEVAIFMQTEDGQWNEQLTENGRPVGFHTVEEAIDYLNRR